MHAKFKESKSHQTSDCNSGKAKNRNARSARFGQENGPRDYSAGECLGDESPKTTAAASFLYDGAVSEPKGRRRQPQLRPVWQVS